jgi:hypothetical protein
MLGFINSILNFVSTRSGYWGLNDSTAVVEGSLLKKTLPAKNNPDTHYQQRQATKLPHFGMENTI